MDECFALHPPGWVKDDWLPNVNSTNLFRDYIKNAPRIVPQGSPTYQGLYLMNYDGEHLAAKFARSSLNDTHQAMRTALQKWKALSEERGDSVRPVPGDKLSLSLGKPPERGGAKLEVCIRDYPRNDGKKIQGEWWYPQAYNFNWLDLTAADMRHFVTSSRQPVTIPSALFQKLTLKSLKDNARGQMSDWKPEELREGSLTTQLVRTDGSRRHFEFAGHADFGNSKATYKCKLLGRATFDTSSGEFTDFKLCSSGIRTGKGGANGRQHDTYPAPLGVCYQLHRSTAN